MPFYPTQKLVADDRNNTSTEAAAQVEEIGTAPQLFLHGCEVPWLLPDHHHVLPRFLRRVLRHLRYRALPGTNLSTHTPLGNHIHFTRWIFGRGM